MEFGRVLQHELLPQLHAALHGLLLAVISSHGCALLISLSDLCAKHCCPCRCCVRRPSELTTHTHPSPQLFRWASLCLSLCLSIRSSMPSESATQATFLSNACLFCCPSEAHGQAMSPPILHLNHHAPISHISAVSAAPVLSCNFPQMSLN